MFIPESLAKSAESRSAHTALFYRDQRISYGDLWVTTRRLASQIAKAIPDNNGRVGLLLENCPEFVYGYYAALTAGAVVVPTNTFLVNPEIEYIYNDAEISLLITSDRFAARLMPILAKIPSLRTVLVVPTEGEAVSLEGSPVPTPSFGEWIHAGHGDFGPRNPDSADAVAALQYTSGTTGKPKGVMLSHGNLLSNAQSVIQATEITPNDRFLMALPAFHSFSQTVCMLSPILAGVSICIVPKVDRAELGFTLINHQPTLFPGVPALFHMLSLAPAPPPDRNPVRLYISGGAPLPPTVQQRFEENYKKPIYEGYGLTEASPVVSWNLPGRNKPGSVGKPLDGIDVQVVDEKGNPLPVGEVGELCVRSASVMKGYYQAEQETAQTIVDGWLHTGDMGRIDADGYISIVERKKELIICKGINVYPGEIERVLLQRPEIADVAVVGIADDAHGEVPEAFIVFHPEKSVPDSELKALCKQNLAAYKVPRRFHVVPQFPKTATGKTKKADLRAQLEARKSEARSQKSE